MSTYLKHIDWKLVIVVLLACYVLPTAVVGLLFASTLHEALSGLIGQALASFVAFFGLFLPPLASGYLAARFARQLPRLQVLAVGVLGAILSLVTFRSSPRAMAVYALACIALAALGGFIRLRGGGHDAA
ncbi:MAG TPA: hypothetical protein VFL64_15055 [Rhizobacter sp.]|nr:hypothetical protein [Rhizobacter sp.]